MLDVEVRPQFLNTIQRPQFLEQEKENEVKKNILFTSHVFPMILFRKIRGEETCNVTFGIG
jgi:hypothetical protein